MAYYGRRPVTALHWPGSRRLPRKSADPLAIRSDIVSALLGILSAALGEDCRPEAAAEAAGSGTAPAVLNGAAQAGADAPAAADADAPASADGTNETGHSAPAATIAKAESAYSAKILRGPDPDPLTGAALPEDTAQRMLWGASDPEGEKKDALPADPQAQMTRIAASAPGGVAARLRRAVPAALAPGAAAAAEGASWGLTYTAAFSDIYLNPYFDYLAYARTKSIPASGSEYYHFVQFGEEGDVPYLQLSLQITSIGHYFYNYTYRYYRNGQVMGGTTTMFGGRMTDSEGPSQETIINAYTLMNWWVHVSGEPGGVTWFSDDAASIAAFDPDYWEP